ncbi:MAG TPA: RnfH family protein [Magnetospirillum sp.]|jgi:putative ubiquitin-RnfH superfamily antitoxin RatB of RatAB toxin-antitoxin module|nr:RnfH family protein [Magnetospirillum sp.]
MNVKVVYAKPQRQMVLSVDLPDGATVKDALDKSGILTRCPEIDLATQKVGVWGKAAELDAVLEPDSRVEIYRPITCDPKTVKRRAKPEEAGTAG